MKLQHLDVPLVATVGARGRFTLPKAAREHLSLAEGDALLVLVGERSLHLVPADLVSRDELWSFTGPIRRRIESAEEEVGSGRAAEVTRPRSLRTTTRHLLAGDS